MAIVWNAERILGQKAFVDFNIFGERNVVGMVQVAADDPQVMWRGIADGKRFTIEKCTDTMEYRRNHKVSCLKEGGQETGHIYLRRKLQGCRLERHWELVRQGKVYRMFMYGNADFLRCKIISEGDNVALIEMRMPNNPNEKLCFQISSETTLHQYIAIIFLCRLYGEYFNSRGGVRAKKLRRIAIRTSVVW